MEFAKRTELRIRRQANKTFVLHVNNVEAARGSPLPQKKISRKERKDRKEMKGGNGESAANVVTLCLKCATPTDAADNLLWM